jgi:hypothetical protein
MVLGRLPQSGLRLGGAVLPRRRSSPARGNLATLVRQIST